MVKIDWSPVAKFQFQDNLLYAQLMFGQKTARRWAESVERIEQILRIDTLQLAILHLAQLAESMVNLGEGLLLGRSNRTHHIGLAVSPSHLYHHLLEETDFVIGNVDSNCCHNH